MNHQPLPELINTCQQLLGQNRQHPDFKTQQQELTLNDALNLDGAAGAKVLEDLDNIFGLLADFKQAYPHAYKYLCANSGDLTLGDAIQAVAQTLEVLEE
jgi:hypothetical protein